MTTCFHKYTPPEGQTQVIARAQSISLIRCLFRLVKCKFTEPLYKSAWYTLLSLLIFSTYALSIKREGHNLKKKKKKEISRLLRLLHSSAVMLSKARYCDIAVIATALVRSKDVLCINYLLMNLPSALITMFYFVLVYWSVQWKLPVYLFPAGLVGGLSKQIWHVKRVSNSAWSIPEQPSSECSDHRCTH